jgi:hypothetical protein
MPLHRTQHTSEPEWPRFGQTIGYAFLGILTLIFILALLSNPGLPMASDAVAS